MMVIPLGDATRRPYRVPVMTLAIIAVNAAAFLAELSGGEALIRQWALIPAEVSHGRHLITILTSMFLHGSWSHIIGNMVFLWAFGPVIEDSMGRRYLMFYLLGGVTATAVQVLTNPASTIPNLGASGAIAAVMGAFFVTYPRDRIRSLLFIFVFVRVTNIPAALMVGVWFLTQLVNLGSVTPDAQEGVAYAAHVGGFVFGLVTAGLFQSGVAGRAS